MACVLKKIFILCSGRRATSTPSPFLWGSIARCGVKHGASVSWAHEGLCIVGKHTCELSSFQTRVEVVVHGHLWPRGFSQDSCTGATCANLSSYSRYVVKKQLLRFYALLNSLKTLGPPAFLLCFSEQTLLPSVLPQPQGGEREFLWGSRLISPLISWLLPVLRSSHLGHQATLLWVFNGILWKMMAQRSRAGLRVQQDSWGSVGFPLEPGGRAGKAC